MRHEKFVSWDRVKIMINPSTTEEKFDDIRENSMIMPYGPRSSNQFEYFVLLPNYWNFWVFEFFNSVRLFYEPYLQIFVQCIINTPLNSKPMNLFYFIYNVPFLKYKWFSFRLQSDTNSGHQTKLFALKIM